MIGYPFIELDYVDSTNSYAMSEVHAGKALHGIAYMAYCQNEGRGQRGNQWQALAGENITLSIVLKPPTNYQHQPFLCSMALAVSVYQFLKTYIGEEVSIKWPNDIYWQNRKIAGILIENSYHGNRWEWAIGGIGININQTVFKGLEHKAVSLRQITGKTWELVSLAKELCAIIDDIWETWQQQGSTWLVTIYNEALFYKDKIHFFKRDNIQFEAKVIGVGVMGNLILQHSIVEHFMHKDVEWIIPV